MSSAGQAIGAIGGAVAGFFIAGPLGAVKGAAYGAAIGGYIDPPPGPNLRGPTLEDKSFQSAAYGVSIPRLYGTIATMGNIIYLENNEYKAVSKKESQGGKGGGGGGTYETTTYFATFAVALAEAVPGSVPIRIWAGAKLVYQLRSAGVEFKEIDFKFYDGTQTEPDSRMEAVLGVGNCPAYEGTAYLMVYDLNLTEFGNGLAGCPLKVELGAVTFLGEPVFAGGYVATFSPDDAPGATTLRPMKSARFYSASIMKDSSETSRILTQSIDAQLRISHDVFETDNWARGFIPGVAQDADWAIRYEYYTEAGVLNIGVMTNGVERRNGYSRRPLVSSGEYVTPYRVYQPPGRDYMFLGRAGATVPDDVAAIAPNGWYLSSFETEAPFIDFGTQSQDPGCVVVGRQFCVRISAESLGDVYVYNNAGDLYKQFHITLPVAFEGGRALYRPGLFLSEFSFVFLLSGISDTAAGILRLVTVDIESEDFRVYVVAVPPTEVSSGFDFPSISIVENLLCVGQNQGPYQYRFWLIDLLPVESSGDGATLAKIVDEWALLSGIPDEKFDSSALLGDRVKGYRVSEKTSARGALEQLKASYLFDIVERGYGLVCVKRGDTAALQIPKEKLVISNNRLFGRSEDSRMIMPARYYVNYLDPSREYDANTQYADFPSAFDGQQSIDLAVVMLDDQAAQLADILMKTTWSENHLYDFVLPQEFIGLAPADVIAVEFTAGSSTQVRIENISEVGSQTLSIQARSTQVETYSSSAVGIPGSITVRDPVLQGDTKILMLDLPLLDDSLDLPGFMTGAVGYEGWPGGLLARSVDGGQSYTALERYDGETTCAVADSVLLTHDGLVVDSTSELRVWMKSGVFASVTTEQLMAGANYIAYGANGRWEICQFMLAEPNVDGSISLSGFVRGLAGTEWATGKHSVGDFIYLLGDSDNRFVGVNGNTIGVPYLYKSLTVGQSMDRAVAEPFAYMGSNLRPLSPVNPVTRRLAGGDLTISFRERTRFSSSFWYSGLLPRREYPIAFEMDVYNDGQVVRTLSSIVPEFQYSSEQQLEDFGFVPSQIRVMIFQLNQHVGRGYALEVTI